MSLPLPKVIDLEKEYVICLEHGEYGTRTERVPAIALLTYRPPRGGWYVMEILEGA